MLISAEKVEVVSLNIEAISAKLTSEYAKKRKPNQNVTNN